MKRILIIGVFCACFGAQAMTVEGSEVVHKLRRADWSFSPTTLKGPGFGVLVIHGWLEQGCVDEAKNEINDARPSDLVGPYRIKGAADFDSNEEITLHAYLRRMRSVHGSIYEDVLQALEEKIKDLQ